MPASDAASSSPSPGAYRGALAATRRSAKLAKSQIIDVVKIRECSSFNVSRPGIKQLAIDKVRDTFDHSNRTILILAGTTAMLNMPREAARCERTGATP
jgi:hypothetical protein